KETQMHRVRRESSGNKISFMRQGPDRPAGGSGSCPLLRRGRAMASARLRLDGRERGWTAGVDALGVTETTGAVPRAAIGIGGDVEDDVVGTRRIAGHSPDTRQGTRGRHVVEAQSVAHAPGDIVVGAGGIAAHADAANDNVARGVEGESSAEHVNAANPLANHRVGSGTVICR